MSSTFKRGVVQAEPYGLKEFAPAIGGAVTNERDAYEKGFKAGEEAGYAFGEQKAKLFFERMNGVLEELSNFSEKMRDKLEPEVVELVFEVARKVIHAEVQTNKDVVVNIAKEALKSVGNWKEIIICVNPVDYDYITKNGKDLAGMSRTISFESDESIQPGGCIIQEEYGEIDARIDEQLNEIYDEVKNK